MENFKLPRSTLELLPTAILKGVLVALLERADENGRLTISIRDFANEIGMEYQPLRTALKKIYTNAIANAIATQRLTQITICNIESYTLPARKQQRNSNATANAITTPQKTTRFKPPTEQEVQDHVAQKGYHICPAEFVSFYQGKGWKVGDQPMKDWQAACRTWELRWKEKYGERLNNELPKYANRADPRAAEREQLGSELRCALDAISSAQRQ